MALPQDGFGPSASGTHGRNRFSRKLTLGLRTLAMESVGTFVTNLFALGVLFTAAQTAGSAQAHTLLDTAGGAAMPPGTADVPGAVPDPLGTVTVPGFPGGKGSPPHRHLYVAFPNDALFVAVGVGLAYGLGLTVAPGCALNPTFSVATAMVEKGRWPLLPFAVAGQMVGGIAACGALYSMAWGLLRPAVPSPDGYLWGGVPKTLATSAAFGVALPAESLPPAVAFWNTLLFTVLLVQGMLPALHGEHLHKSVKPWVVALVVAAFATASAPFGVQANPAAHFSALIFCTAAGWPSSLWSAGHGYAATAATAPLLGAVLGALLHRAWAWLTTDPSSPLVWNGQCAEDCGGPEGARAPLTH